MEQPADEEEPAADVDVLVLGAGMAGLAAALALQQGGVSLLVLEARDRAGGRVHSVPLTHGSNADLGAAWIHGAEGNPLAALAAAHGLPTLPTDTVTTTLRSPAGGARLPAAEADAHRALFAGFLRHLEQLRARGALSAADSVRDVLRGFASARALRAAERAGLALHVDARIVEEYGADADRLSALHYDHDDPLPGPDLLLPGGGAGQLPAALAAGLAPGRLRLRHAVTRVAWQQRAAGGVLVEADTPAGRRRFAARAALVTLPLGVLKARAGELFDPPLPAAKAAAIARLGVGLLNKVMLLYEGPPFWDDTPWINRMPNGGVHAGRWQEWFNASRYLCDGANESMLVAFSAGSAAWSAEQDSNEELTRQVTDVLAELYPHAAKRQPKQVLITRWGADPWSLGSYACMAAGCTPDDISALAAPAGCLFFAGEATSPSNQGTMHGAYSSGQAAAQDVLDALHCNGKVTAR